MSLLTLNEAPPKDVGEVSLIRDEHLVANFVVTYSASKILEDLGYTNLSKELSYFMKSLGGELVIKLATGHYKPNLAQILYKEISSKKDSVSDKDLYDLLMFALDLKELLIIGGTEAVRSASRTLFTKFVRTMCGESNELEKVINREDPRDVLQALATGIAIFVGGFHGV